MGDSTDNEEFTAVLCLSRDVEVAAERADAGVKRWGLRHLALLREMDATAAAAEDAGEGDDDDDDGMIIVGSGAGAARKGRKAASASAAASASSAATAASAASSSSSSSSSVKLTPTVVSAITSSTVSGVKDPTLAAGAGIAKLTFVAPDMTVREYEHFLREQAYDTMDGLTKQHCLAQAAGLGRGAGAGGGGAASMNRLMRVSAEMSNLPTLACHWASSILVRQDESSMDVMRAAMTGPADTPYMNGEGRGRSWCLFFDVIFDID